MTSPTRIGVTPGERRSRVHHTTGHLTVRTMDQDADGARVGLLATRALLLSGDDVRIEVDVAPGAWLDVVETTGTVAYEGDAPSSWTIDADVGDGGVLTWAGMPFVVSDEITTHRGTHIRLHGTGKVLMQEKVVLGRAGQTGGDLTTSLDASDDTGPVQVEYLDLGRQARQMPGVFGRLRSMDTVTALGWKPEPSGEPERGPHRARGDLLSLGPVRGRAAVDGNRPVPRQAVRLHLRRLARSRHERLPAPTRCMTPAPRRGARPRRRWLWPGRGRHGIRGRARPACPRLDPENATASG